MAVKRMVPGQKAPCSRFGNDFANGIAFDPLVL